MQGKRWAALLIWIAIQCSGIMAADIVEPLIGAHYYPWYESQRWNYSECAAGTLRSELIPSQHPFLGSYDSRNPAVIEQHLDWCSEYNIGLLILEFYRPGSRSDITCREQILDNAHAGSVSFSVLYDWAIRFGSFEITPERLDTVRSDFTYLAQNYFSSPWFLRSPDGRPVVFLYVTRALQGDVPGFIDVMREAVWEEAGVYPFLVGDEFFFLNSPQASKISRWDAIFGYDVYGSRGGYWGENGTLDFFRSRANAFHDKAVQSGTVFFPSLMPGFNDRAVRRTCANNPAASRRLAPESSPVSLFAALFDRVLEEDLDPAFPVVSITSFNEWHEDTQIEPTAGGNVSTAEDTSESGTQYTQGLPYDDYGFDYFELIRDRTVAISGIVRKEGSPVVGAEVIVRAPGMPSMKTLTDTFGRFKVTRAMLQESGNSLSMRAASENAFYSDILPVEVNPEVTILSDLELYPVPIPDLSVDITGDHLRLSCQGQAGFLYQFMESDDLMEWRTLGEPEEGSGLEMERLVPRNGAPVRFWKVIVTAIME